MTLATIGFGAAFQTQSGASWLTVAETFSMQLPPITRDAIDAGHECMPGEWVSAVTGLKHAGEVVVELNFTNAQYIALAAELDTETPAARRILFPDGSTFPFTAFLVGLEAGIVLADRRTAAAKFHVIGAPGPLTIP